MQQRAIDQILTREPRDYFSGVATRPLRAPTNVLLFVRLSRDTLQQKALQNRSHHRHVLIFNLQAKGTVHLDHRTIRLAPGDALLVQPFQFHHFSQTDSSHLRWLFCTFETSDAPHLERFRNRAIQLNEVSLHARDELVRSWSEGAKHNWRPQLLEQRLQLQLQRVLIELEMQLTASQPVEPSHTDSLLHTVHDIISRSRGHYVTVDHVAHALGRSASGLRSEFRRIAGVPLGAYLTNFRVNRALDLLRRSDLPVSEVASESGFTSPQAFSRTIKAHTGLSPRLYRQQSRTDT